MKTKDIIINYKIEGYCQTSSSSVETIMKTKDIIINYKSEGYCKTLSSSVENKNEDKDTKNVSILLVCMGLGDCCASMRIEKRELSCCLWKTINVSSDITTVIKKSGSCPFYLPRLVFPAKSTSFSEWSFYLLVFFFVQLSSQNSSEKSVIFRDLPKLPKSWQRAIGDRRRDKELEEQVSQAAVSD